MTCTVSSAFCGMSSVHAHVSRMRDVQRCLRLLKIVLGSRRGRQLTAVVLLLNVMFLVLFTFSDINSTRVDDARNYIYSSESPLIFIGGFPRSGTTLMRAMLDAHPDIRCGQETRILVRIINFIKNLSNVERKRMEEAGISTQVLDRALASFILEVIVQHGEAAKRLCTKDPFLMTFGNHLQTLFPNAKFIFMVRDGRASIYSAITRKVTIAGFNFSDPGSCLQKWNHAVDQMYQQCSILGQERCMMVNYEQLVLHPAHWMRRILTFLELPWDDAVLHHDSEIDRPGGVKLSVLEKSSDQIIKPVNLEALSKWVGFYSPAVVEDMSNIAPMLSQLGYDPEANPPNYGMPDSFVVNNTNLIAKQVDFWKNKALQLRLNRFIGDEEESDSSENSDMAK